ncbi:putative GPI anchor protein [Phytophthora cinnamomi]|uniref:putative GPI anchor protein n=1 Tax=Phytophthora cinnamomi TaxID=4785 RepID=UPI00355A7E0B|nr:putative GPI anchor protein [Phytophthora cinnamomi]
MDKVSSYDASAGTQDNMVFMNNMNIDYTGADSTQGYSTADGSATRLRSRPSSAARWRMPPTHRTAALATTTTHFMAGTAAPKMFVTKVQMPTGSTANLPAIWMLNAQVAVQLPWIGLRGCGELDVAEVIETNTAQDKVSTHYYFYDGSVPGR